MRDLIRNTAAITILALAPVLHAEPLSYNTIEIDYIDADIDPFSGDGWAIGGSGLIHDKLFLTGRYSDIGTDTSGSDFDVERLSLGIGAFFNPRIEHLSLYGTLTFEDVQVDSNVARFDVDESGVGIEAGARFALLPNLEVSAAGRYLDVDGYFDSNLGGRIGLVWDVLPWLGLSLDYDVNDIDVNGDRGDDERILAGVRLYWEHLNLPGS